jgi:hypothetical protein
MGVDTEVGLGRPEGHHCRMGKLVVRFGQATGEIAGQMAAARGRM